MLLINKQVTNIGKSNVNVSLLALTMFKNPLGVGWGFLPTLWWVGSSLPTSLGSYY
jgi:hypothetical protein